MLNQRYTSTMNIDSHDQAPMKPKMADTSRTNYQRISSSHERGRFRKDNGLGKDQIKNSRMTAAERMVSKDYSIEYEHEDDDLTEYYGRNKGGFGSKSKHQTPKSK